MIHHFRHLPQERKSTEGAFPLFRKNGKGEQLPASRFARGLAGPSAHRQTDQTGRYAEAFLFPVAVAHVKSKVADNNLLPFRRLKMPYFGMAVRLKFPRDRMLPGAGDAALPPGLVKGGGGNLFAPLRQPDPDGRTGL